MAKPGRPTKYKPEFCEKVKELAAKGASKTECAVELGISWQSFHEYQREYPQFSDAVKEAERLCQAWWEKKGREATFGKYEGFSASSYIFQMKNRFPWDWRDQTQVDKRNVDKDGNDLKPATTLSSDQLVAIADALNREY